MKTANKAQDTFTYSLRLFLQQCFVFTYGPTLATTSLIFPDSPNLTAAFVGLGLTREAHPSDPKTATANPMDERAHRTGGEKPSLPPKHPHVHALKKRPERNGYHDAE